MERQNKVPWVYSSRSNQELARRYDQWAQDYDADLKRDFEYRAPEVTAEFFTRYVVSGNSLTRQSPDETRAWGRMPDTNKKGEHFSVLSLGYPFTNPTQSRLPSPHGASNTAHLTNPSQVRIPPPHLSARH